MKIYRFHRFHYSGIWSKILFFYEHFWKLNQIKSNIGPQQRRSGSGRIGSGSRLISKQWKGKLERKRVNFKVVEAEAEAKAESASFKKLDAEAKAEAEALHALHHWCQHPFSTFIFFDSQQCFTALSTVFLFTFFSPSFSSFLWKRRVWSLSRTCSICNGDVLFSFHLETP